MTTVTFEGGTFEWQANQIFGDCAALQDDDDRAADDIRKGLSLTEAMKKYSRL